jgi:hypothetical protein
MSNELDEAKLKTMLPNEAFVVLVVKHTYVLYAMAGWTCSCIKPGGIQMYKITQRINPIHSTFG